MRRIGSNLFLKIFLWFWATVVATGVALILTFVLGPGRVPSPWHSTMAEIARYSGGIAVEAVERGGPPAASAYIRQAEHETHLRMCLFDPAGSAIAGDNCEIFRGLAAHVVAARDFYFSMRFGIGRAALRLQGRDGLEYIFATELPVGRRAVFGSDPAVIMLQLCIPLLVSGVICYLLTRYLTTPILRLREASQQLAAGHLSTRAAASDERRDDLGELVRDFNAMASRIEQLVFRQRQLISDVSHELRSPLARLNVALDLGRQRKGADSAFDHMEEDLGLLNEMIGRLLTLARLDTSVDSLPMVSVDLTELVSQIVSNADFESQVRNVGVSFAAREQYFVRGDAALLHSAIENVIRNAVRYTDAGTTVEVVLEGRDRPGASWVSVLVRDHGCGVPESELAHIFQPFYRTADARDRISGGVGLGLAIADRVVHVHGGAIRASNVSPRGLQIEILLPRLAIEDIGPSSDD
jgi:two-component system sensor histidine kinase CpxA